MYQIPRSGHDIRIAIELLDPSLQRFVDPEHIERRHFTIDLWQYLGELVTDLRIPTKIALETHFSEERDGLDDHMSYRIFVNGTTCRLQLPTMVPSDSQAQGLASAIAKSVYLNRELLITTRLAQHILESWQAAAGEMSWQDLTVEDFQAFLSHLVRRGFAIDRGKEMALNFYQKMQGEWNASACFEEAVAGLDVMRIGLFFKKGARSQSDADSGSLEDLIEQTKDTLSYELGVILPKVHIGYDDRLEAHAFRMQLNDLRLPPILGLSPDQFFIHAAPDSLSFLDASRTHPAIYPPDGSEGTIAKDENGALEKCRERGFTIWGPAGFVMLNLATEMRRQAGNFLTIETVKFGMHLLQERFSALIDATYERFTLPTLVQILRDLLDEEVSIRDFPRILEGLLAISATAAVDWSASLVFLPNTAHICPVVEPKAVRDLNVADYSLFVRIHLQRSIISRCAGGYNTLKYYSTTPDIEREIRHADQHPMTDRQLDSLRQVIFQKIGNSHTQIPVIVTTVDVRKKLRRLIEKELSWLTVLASLEIPPYVNMQRLGQIP